MKQVIIALAIAALSCTSAIAQKCETAVTKQKTAVKHKSKAPASKEVTTRTTACRMLPYQVCTIQPDRRSVVCYTSTDSNEHKQTGPSTFYGPTGPMPGEVVDFKVKTVVIKGKPKGSYCKRNAADNATLCYESGYVLVRDENGYYSYGEAPAHKAAGRVTKK